MNPISRMLRGARKAVPVLPIDPPPPTGLRDSLLGGWFNSATGELCSGFQVGPGDVVADIGCGDGGYASFCANQGAQIILIDIDPAALDRATAKLSSVQPTPSFKALLTDGGDLQIADGAVSRVICTEVFEHVDDPAFLMAELFRIGRPGALYLLSCPDPAAEAIYKRIAHPSYFERPNHIRIIGREEFAAHVEAAGLVIEQRINFGFYWLMWWIFFWGCPQLSGDMRHTLLDSWAQTWSQLLDQKNGPHIRDTLDDLLPKSQAIIARKP